MPLHPLMSNAVEQWVIYMGPTDFPGQWVVRRWLVTAGAVHPDARAVSCATLEEARRIVPAGLYNLGRYSDDDPAIYEVWI